MKEIIEVAKRFKTCCNYDRNNDCPECAYHIQGEEFGVCNGQDENDATMITDYILGMEDDGK